VPDDITFATKIEIALAQVKQAQDDGVSVFTQSDGTVIKLVDGGSVTSGKHNAGC
jgi:hypothetical protein